MDLAHWISTILLVASTLLPRLSEFLVHRFGGLEKPLPETVWAVLSLPFLGVALSLDALVLWIQISPLKFVSQPNQYIIALTIIVAAVQVSGMRVRAALQVLRDVLHTLKQELLDAEAENRKPILAKLESIEQSVAKMREELAAIQRNQRAEVDSPIELSNQEPDRLLTAAVELPRQNQSPASFPITIPNITTTELHAGIIAMAHKLHEEHKGFARLTHVKAEKIAHMIEAQVGINLGRQPIKDAAGPNDFRQLQHVENLARAEKYFDFKQRAGGTYQVRKLGRFDHLIKISRAALGEHCAEVDGLLQWMLRMNVRQAEIVATVFAAWNNLLLDGKQPSDEEIVLEARENWHPNKRKIDREKFFAAVEWLRKQGVVPQGKGRPVRRKGE